MMAKDVENFYKDALQQFNDGILIIDLAGTVQFVNSAFLQISGYDETEVLHKKASNFFTQPTPCSWQGEINLKRKNGSLLNHWLTTNPVENDLGETTHKMFLFSTFQKSGLDSLTKLPNRFLLQQELQKTLTYSRQNERIFAVLFLDLDRFKFVNDTLGHSYGDLLLQQVSQRLKSSLGNDHIVARMGGDEFICILEGIESEADAEKLTKIILEQFALPFHLNEIEIHITTSIGVSLYPYDGDEAEVLISNADSAMYRAKKKGRNQFEMAKVEVNAGAFERLIIENDLRKAIDNHQLSISYQPQLDLKTNRILGFEALLRWNHPDFGMIPPSDFIPIAEETGLILPIGDWVLKNACLQIKQWERAGFYSLHVAVNLSAQQFLQKNIVEKIEAVIKETKIDPSLLELEITESMVIHDIDSAVSVLQQLKDLGVQISIDDFGTGYSSLNYLKKLPVNTLKIDRSFIFDIDINPSSKALTTAITTLAHDLNLNVVAEGVETYKQLSYVKKSSCDAVQGFYFSKPLPSANVIDFLNKTKKVVQKNA
ncbi:EAL domain-containing protein [Anaerobacillus isosaccharinicus]|uniref:EAL domain-containing protein n=2 Tax=Anaerobacillus isosaccharinicus TaxID=1532552 RepID=A0A7S7LCM9_9BACI|nr:GGDEF and EAL domain-containing protein [Anaerobacillus isosaccharinicus]